MSSLWVATGNQGKLREFEKLLAPLEKEIKSAKDLPIFQSPPETADSFEGNARIKAKALKAMVPNEDWVLADDSGLCVEGLNGLPGVHSARYAGDKASMSENIAKLLKMLQLRSPSHRKAFFECTLVLLKPDNKEIVSHGRMQGEIALSLKGSGGFGYDPVFCPEGLEKTLAELPPQEKNRLSHRAQATRQLLELLEGDTH